MSLISRMRKQKAMWFQKTGQDQFGQATFADAVEIDCRWEGKQVLFKDAFNTDQMSKALVYVDRDMSPLDMLLELTQAEYDALNETDPHKIDAAAEIRRFDTLPNLRATENLLTAYVI